MLEVFGSARSSCPNGPAFKDCVGGSLSIISQSFAIEELDFTVPLVWEGNRDQLHTSDECALEQGHRGRLFSGSAGLALALSRAGVEERWGRLSGISWQFSAPVYLNDTLTARLVDDDRSDVRGTVVSGDTEISSGTLFFGRTALPGSSAMPSGTESISRTVTEGDAELFSWWTTHVQPSVRKHYVVPTVVTVLLGSGFVSNLRRFAQRDLSPVLRSYNWHFHQSMPLGATVVVALADEQERRSKSKPEWTIWTGRLCMAPAREQAPWVEGHFTVFYKSPHDWWAQSPDDVVGA